jgi:hypothetical protein
MIEYISIAIMGGLLITGIFWVVRTIRKDRKEERDHYDPGKALS